MDEGSSTLFIYMCYELIDLWAEANFQWQSRGVLQLTMAILAYGSLAWASKFNWVALSPIYSRWSLTGR